MRTLALLLGAVLLLAGCGVQPQRGPETLVLSDSPTPDTVPAPDDGAAPASVYFVRGARLEAADRTAADTRVATVLALLTAGPTRSEVLSGLRTAVAPQMLTVRDVPPPGMTVVVDLTREFTGVSGGNQLLAVAQVVWTLTEVSEVTTVRFTSGAGPVEVPTDEGLTDLPVSRGDYRSVAPRAAAIRSAPPEGD